MHSDNSSGQRWVEPFRFDDGRLGFAFVDGDGILIYDLNEAHDYLRDDKEGWKYVENLVNRSFWDLPGEPDIDFDDTALARDITRFIAENVHFTDDRYYSFLGNWTISTGLVDLMTHLIRLIVYGLTRSGKSRLLRTLRLVCYRGCEFLDPTGPGLFRLIEVYHPTFFLDEYHNVRGEKKEDVDLLIRGGFERGKKLPRFNKNTSEVDIFDSFSFMAMGTQRLPAADVLNRALLVRMLEKPPDAEIARRIDEEEARRLRTRLFAFRLRVLSGRVDLGEATAKAWNLAESPIIVDGSPVLLDDRSIDLAANVLVPAAYFNDCDDVLALIAESQRQAVEGLRDSIEGDVVFALQNELAAQRRATLDNGFGIEVSKISTTMITQRLNVNRKDAGDEGREEVKTRTVGGLLRGMGFAFKPGASNKSFFDPASFGIVYPIAARKFGFKAVEGEFH